MKLLKFDTYEDYVKTQTKTNKRKLQFVWVSDKELKAISKYIQAHIPDASLGICHGVRNGYEVQKLRMLLGFEIIGTEISDTALKMPNVIQWDFHEIKDEWINSVDFIYSNSWDHSYDPDQMLANWMKCIRQNGRSFLEWTPEHKDSEVRGADCFGGSLNEIIEWVNKSYEVETVLEIKERVGGGIRFLNILRWIIIDKCRPRDTRVIVVKHKDQ